MWQPFYKVGRSDGHPSRWTSGYELLARATDTAEHNTAKGSYREGALTHASIERNSSMTFGLTSERSPAQPISSRNSVESANF